MLAVRTPQLPPVLMIVPAYTDVGKDRTIMKKNDTHRLTYDAEKELSLGEDLITGAEQIARELQWKMKDGRWNRRRVYHLAAKGEVPIYRVKGLGICARKSALRRYFNTLDECRLGKLNSEGGGRQD